tara:strand:+ start:1161 stop:2024 length:864 start_codon:yes stop_codon:yes gene_type:complete
MKKIKYLIEFLFIKMFFFIFKIIGYKNASNLGAKIGSIFGPLFRSKKITENNIKSCIPNIEDKEKNKLIKKMWENYGRIFSEYMFIQKFRSKELEKYLNINGKKILEEIRRNNKPVIFISGHFNNFELMAMQLELFGIKLSSIYRPLNNIFLNKTMENLRKNFICKNQIKKGIGGIREVVKAISENTSIALMIDQRVTEGEKSLLFNMPTYTTTIPAQLVKKYNCPVVPIYIERKNKIYFDITVESPIHFTKNDDIESITQKLNTWLEKKILVNPDQWIWTHNKWKL